MKILKMSGTIFVDIFPKTLLKHTELWTLDMCDMAYGHSVHCIHLGEDELSLQLFDAILSGHFETQAIWGDCI